jgi:uncharacterized integral membrane protein (TIGR00698 family)
MSTINATPLHRKPSRLEKNLFGTNIGQVHLLLPGLLTAALLAWVSIWLSQWIGCDILCFEKTPLSAATVAILLGLIANNVLPVPGFLRPGLTFAIKKILRLGIIMLGIRLSIFDVLKLGATGVPVVLSCILGALLCTRLLSKWLKVPERLGTLIAVGTSICGVSAIVATGPAIDAKDEEVAYAVSVITLFGIVATFVYPYAAYAIFGGHPVAGGLFLGTAIHDTSQVTGAALVYSDAFSLPRGVDVATVTKLVRNVFMAVAIPFMAFDYARRAGSKGGSGAKRTAFHKLLPRFVVGFLLLAALRSLGDAGINAGDQALGVWDPAAWKGACDSIVHWAVNLLVVALAAVGLSTNARILRGLGLGPLIVGLGAALIVGGISILSISLLGIFVTF